VADPLYDPSPGYVVPPTTYNRVCQAGHFLAGLCAVFGPAAVLPYDWRFYGAGLMLVWALCKEFGYDMIWETKDGRGSSLEDFSFYMAGDLLALALVLQFGN